jgi:phosphoribosylformimino-5-aminoimidazole carboxamide ribonucleotide (ProFAR) isomerase
MDDIEKFRGLCAAIYDQNYVIKFGEFEPTSTFAWVNAVKEQIVAIGFNIDTVDNDVYTVGWDQTTEIRPANLIKQCPTFGELKILLLLLGTITDMKIDYMVEAIDTIIEHWKLERI